MRMTREEEESLQLHTDIITNIELLMYLDGMNQTSIAKQMGVAQSDVSNILAGKRALTELWLGRFAKALRVEPEILMEVNLRGAILESLRNPIFDEAEPPKKKGQGRPRTRKK